MENGGVVSERLRRLHRLIDRAKPVFEKHASGELRVLSEAQRRQVEMYPLWLQDLECLKQGRVPPSRPSKASSAGGHAPNGAVSPDKIPAADTTVGVEAESGSEPEVAGDAAAQRGGDGSATVGKNGEEVTEEKSQSQQQPGCPEAKKKGNGKNPMATDGFVGNFESEKERVVERLLSLPPAAREPFVFKYLRKITDAEELRIVKKRFESANNLRQKMISGDIKCPSKSQLEIIKALPELRSTLSVLKHHAKMEERRAMKFFLQRLEEMTEEEERRGQLCSIAAAENGNERRGDENVATGSSATGETAPNDSAAEEIAETHTESPLPAVNTRVAEGTDSAMRQEGNCVFIHHETMANARNGHGPPVQSEAESEKLVHRDPFLSGRISASGSSAVKDFVLSPEVSHEVGPSSSGDSERERISTHFVDCPNLKFSKDDLRLEMKMPCVNLGTEQQNQQQRQQKKESRQRKSDKNTTAGSTRSDDGSISVGPGKTAGEVVKQQNMLDMPSHATMEKLGFVQLYISIISRGRASGVRDQSARIKEPDLRVAAVLRRVEKELQHVLRHPIPNVTVINSQVQLNEDNSPHLKSDTKREHIVVSWDVHVSPSDGPLAGQVVRVVVAFSEQYPFVPPLIYSTVFLPLNMLMVSESGQCNTLRLFSTCGSAVTDADTKPVNTKSIVWRPELDIHGVFYRLPSFFGAEAFAASREALGQELYSSSVAEARLACGKSAVEFLLGNVKMAVPTPPTLEMVNGPFLVFSHAAGGVQREWKETNKDGNAKQKGKRSALCSETVRYYEDGDGGVIRGPFRGCWGHLLQMRLPCVRARRNQRGRNKTKPRGVLGPILTARLWALKGDVFPELELVAISEHSAVSKESFWARSVLRAPRNESLNGDNSQQTFGVSSVIARRHVKLHATAEKRSAVVRFFVEEEGCKDENDKSPLPRCVDGDQAGVTHVHLPRSSAPFSPEGEATPLSWAIVLHVEDGCSATVVFSVPAAGIHVEDLRNVVKAGTHVSDDAVDLVADTVPDSAGHISDRRISPCCNPASLRCVASLDAEEEAGLLGVLCEVIHPPPSTHVFVPKNVVVLPRLILSERSFDAHFSCGTKKFFIASSPFSPCTFFLPLAHPHETLPQTTQNRLKLSVTQVQRNPDASTAYAPPFKEKWALRFFAFALKSIGREWMAVHGAGAAEGETRGSFLHAVYARIMCTFTQLVQGEAGLQKLCHSVTAHELTSDRFVDTRTSHRKDTEELDVLEWLLASWCIQTNLGAHEAENTTATSRTTMWQPIRKDWLVTTNKLMAYLKEGHNKDFVAQLQLHVKILDAVTAQ